MGHGLGSLTALLSSAGLLPEGAALAAGEHPVRPRVRPVHRGRAGTEDFLYAGDPRGDRPHHHVFPPTRGRVTGGCSRIKA